MVMFLLGMVAGIVLVIGFALMRASGRASEMERAEQTETPCEHDWIEKGREYGPVGVTVFEQCRHCGRRASSWVSLCEHDYESVAILPSVDGKYRVETRRCRRCGSRDITRTPLPASGAFDTAPKG